VLSAVHATLVATTLLTSLLLIVSVLAQRGSGGGLSDMFGGGGSQLASSAQANRNLARITVVLTAIWVVSTVALAILGRPA
jgi:preprotein translocase subunit SecG